MLGVGGGGLWPMRFKFGSENSALAHHLPSLIGWLAASLFVNNIGIIVQGGGGKRFYIFNSE
jgi:hypothetical protein